MPSIFLIFFVLYHFVCNRYYMSEMIFFGQRAALMRATECYLSSCDVSRFKAMIKEAIS